MSLLFDGNLSQRLVARLSDLFPGSKHLFQASLTRRDDVVVFDYARAHGLAIVTRDDDFRKLSRERGAPPKVIMINLGNSSTNRMEAFIRSRGLIIQRFLDDRTTALIELDP